MENKFQFNHQEAVKYVKTMLACFNITEYDIFEKSYDIEDEYYYDSKSHYDYTKFSGLPASFEMGHIKIEILKSSLSLSLMINQKKELNEDEHKLYKKKILKISDDIRNIKLRKYSISDHNVDNKSGYNFGNNIDEKTLIHFNDLFAIILGSHFNTNYIIKLAAKKYEQNREINNFIELVSHAWNMHPNLWNTNNSFSTQYGEISSIWLYNKFEDLKWYDNE